MWHKFKNKLIDWCSSLVAFIIIVIFGALMLIVPITFILACAKLIMMMFGVGC